MAAVARRRGDDPQISSYYEQRQTLAATERGVEPERVDGRPLDAWTIREAGIARGQFVARLDAGARTRQPLLAAIAQVNFDCWVVPFKRKIGVPDRDECRRRFYFAFAGLLPPGTVPSGPVETVQVVEVAPKAAPSQPSTNGQLPAPGAPVAAPAAADPAPAGLAPAAEARGPAAAEPAAVLGRELINRRP